MNDDMSGIDDKALDSLAVAPTQDDAGEDAQIADRVESTPDDSDARLDAGLDESMDASDPIASTQPGSDGPAPSSGYDAEAEARRSADD